MFLKELCTAKGMSESVESQLFLATGGIWKILPYKLLLFSVLDTYKKMFNKEETFSRKTFEPWNRRILSEKLCDYSISKISLEFVSRC